MSTKYKIQVQFKYQSLPCTARLSAVYIHTVPKGERGRSGEMNSIARSEEYETLISSPETEKREQGHIINIYESGQV